MKRLLESSDNKHLTMTRNNTTVFLEDYKSEQEVKKMADGIFKERFAALLKARGLSQKELAQKTSLTEGAVSHYLKGDREPKGAILLNIANALETSTDYLSGRTNEVKPAGADSEIEKAFQLVARNAQNMTAEDRERFLKILYGGK